MWLCGGSHLSCLWWSDSAHVWSLWLEVVSLLIALVILSWSAIPSKVLLSTVSLILHTSLHHSLGFFFSVKDHQLLAELLVRHAELLSDLNETSETVDVVRMVVVDLLIDLERLIEEVHPAIAGGDHELPFDFLHLDLGSSLEVKDSLFEHVLFGIVHTEARDDIDLGWVVSVTLLVVVNSLELILLLLVEVTHLSEDLRVSWDLGYENVVPLEGLSSHTDKFVDMSNLVDDLITIWDDGVKLLKSLKTLIVIVKSLVNQSKVIDCFNAISLDTDSLKEELLCSIVVLEVVETVTLVELYLSCWMARSAKDSAFLKSFSRKYKKEMLLEAIAIMILSFFSKPLKLSIALSISLFLM